jgi:uncharacterized damage-inducible protein DinB
MTSHELRELLAYQRWANQAFLEALRALPADALDQRLESSFSSLRGTLVHLVGAELIWVDRWEGGPGELPADFEEAGLEALAATLEEVARRQDAVLDRLGDEGLEAELVYRDRAGNPHRSIHRHMIQHVVNHGTYHRGQLATLLRQVGVVPPSTDFIKYTRRRV